MSKLTFEQLAQAFNEMMAELEKSRVANYTTGTAPDKEQTSTENVCNSCCEDQCGDSELVSTPLEDLITKQIYKHLDEGTFPSLEEAQAMHILDSINYRYNR